MNFAVTVILIIVGTVAYTVYLGQKYGEDALDGIPKPLRWVYLPCYVISCVYITSLLLHWGLIVPGLIQWILNLTLYLLDWKVISLIYQIISDLLYTPILAMIVALPCVVPQFKSDIRFTCVFRLITLGCTLPVHIYSINFYLNSGDAMDWLDRTIYDVALAFAAYFAYIMIMEDYRDARNGIKKKDFMEQLETLWGRVKGLFS